ncbi:MULTISPECIES: hypothetical protein [Pseudomonas]|jgi:hypothetical protein|uniref:hypothetical protein n=1 Tax=Pseudomonas TaxID=286 RepID=UPI0008129D7F|nr:MULTISPECIES: hypothetical protein [Pseudomonas]RZI23698.1 hypothetical protein EUX53_11905 [Pseudomonas orientalis]CRM22829.1 hypothetical protein [Pseudomonas sp. 28 E 9]
MTAIEIIKQFVEGAISPKAFEEKIYADPAVEALLKNEDNLPAYVTEPDLYTYAISQDYQNLESIYNVQTLLSTVLTKKNITHTVEKKYENLFNLTLKVQPKWLSLSSDYLSKLVEERKNLSPKELQVWLKEKIKTDFRCLKAPPKWLQSPVWPMADGKPMVFLGQLDISELSHDNAQVYLFFDEGKQTFHTVTQAC